MYDSHVTGINLFLLCCWIPFMRLKKKNGQALGNSRRAKHTDPYNQLFSTTVTVFSWGFFVSQGASQKCPK